MAEPSSDNRSVEQIEREIADTRSQMDHTVDVLRYKISPARVRSRTMQRLRPEGGVVEAARRQMRRNPLLYSLLGSALVWRLVSGRGNGLSRAELERISAQAAAAGYHRGRADALREARVTYLRRGGERRRALRQRTGDLRDELRYQWQAHRPQTELSWLGGLLGPLVGAGLQRVLARREGPLQRRTRAAREGLEAMPESVAAEEVGFPSAVRRPVPPEPPGHYDPTRPADR